MSIQQLALVLRVRQLLERHQGKPLLPGEYSLLMQLANCADKHGDRIFPGERRLMAATGFSASYLRRLRRRLQDRGWLIVARAGGGRGRRAIFRLNLPTTGDPTQLDLPLLKSCRNPADEETEKRTCRSANEDLQVPVIVGNSPTNVLRVNNLRAPDFADPSSTDPSSTTQKEKKAGTR